MRSNIFRPTVAFPFEIESLSAMNNFECQRKTQKFFDTQNFNGQHTKQTKCAQAIFVPKLTAVFMSSTIFGVIFSNDS